MNKTRLQFCNLFIVTTSEQGKNNNAIFPLTITKLFAKM